MSSDVISIEHLKTYFPVKGRFGAVKGYAKAVDDVTLSIKEGETLGLVGESGSGKTTLGRSILRLVEPTSGKILLNGADLVALRSKEMRKLRRNMQIVFQDPYSSLNPRMTVKALLSEPFQVNGMGGNHDDDISDLLKAVGLKEEQADRYPHEFSGGQRQRIALARAIALKPKLLILDEPTSALDVSVQAQILNLLKDLQKTLHLTYLFISHNLLIIKTMSDRIAVMYAGEIVELGNAEDVYHNPLHPYTQVFVSAIPVPDPDTKLKETNAPGEVPNPMDFPPGCRFHPRCPYVMAVCKEEIPELTDMGNGYMVACHLYTNESGRKKLTPLIAETAPA